MNINLPDDRQDVGDPYRQYIEYLAYGVKEGSIDERVASEILENEDWEAVERMMFVGEQVMDRVLEEGLEDEDE